MSSHNRLYGMISDDATVHLVEIGNGILVGYIKILKKTA
jgi:hypothetical protein